MKKLRTIFHWMSLLSNPFEEKKDMSWSWSWSSRPPPQHLASAANPRRNVWKSESFRRRPWSVSKDIWYGLQLLPQDHQTRILDTWSDVENCKFVLSFIRDILLRIRIHLKNQQVSFKHKKTNVKICYLIEEIQTTRTETTNLTVSLLASQVLPFF